MQVLGPSQGAGGVSARPVQAQLAVPKWNLPSSPWGHCMQTLRTISWQLGTSWESDFGCFHITVLLAPERRDLGAGWPLLLGCSEHVAWRGAHPTSRSSRAPTAGVPPSPAHLGLHKAQWLWCRIGSGHPPS